MNNMDTSCTGSTLDKLPVEGEFFENNIEKKELNDDNIFPYFNEKYLLLKSKRPSDDYPEQVTEDKQEINCDEKTKLLLESMVEELNKEIIKVGDKHKHFLRFLGMKIFLQHILAKFIDDEESMSILEKAYNEAKPYVSKPEVIYTVFLVLNNLANLNSKSNSTSLGLNKRKKMLEDCYKIYKISQDTNKSGNYYCGKELFSPEKEMPQNKEAKIKYEKLVITNLLLLGSVYEKLGLYYKDIVCYHTAFKKMLDNSLVNPYKWVDFTTRLACVCIDDNYFTEARHHLAAATHVHELLELKQSSSGDSERNELIKSNSVHLALAWIRYCLILFERSKDEDRKKFASFFKNGCLHPHQSQTEKSSTGNEENDCHVMNDKNIVFENPKFMESFDEDINDDYYDFNGIINENCMIFGSFMGEIMQCHRKDSINVNKINSKLQTDIKKYDDKQTSDVADEGSSSENTITLEENPTVPSIEVEETGKELETVNDDVEIKDNSEKLTDGTDAQNEYEKSNKEEENTNEETEYNKEKENGEKEGEETVENNLTFSSLGYLPIEHTVTKDFIQTSEDAKNLFKFGHDWAHRAQTYFPKSQNFSSYVNVVLNMVSLYRLCAYFQGRANLEYRINLEQTRENLLEHLVSEVAAIEPESHLHVRVYQEMALLNVDLAMLNMCNIYNIHMDDTYKLCALTEIQYHINHVYIINDMLQRSTKAYDESKSSDESSPTQSTSSESTSTNVD